MSSSPQIRPATPADRSAFYEICLKTSDNGDDGSHLHDDHEALGNIYVGPYLKLESRFALALEDNDGVCGYCLAAEDSKPFYHRFVHEWLPPIQRTLTPPTGAPTDWTVTQNLHHLLLNPDELTFFPEAFAAWPAHIHVDLLPRAQGRGLGRRLMETQMNQLRESGAGGVHLCVSPANTRALQFYRKLGFESMPRAETWPADTTYLGKRLNV